MDCATFNIIQNNSKCISKLSQNVKKIDKLCKNIKKIDKLISDNMDEFTDNSKNFIGDSGGNIDGTIGILNGMDRDPINGDRYSSTDNKNSYTYQNNSWNLEPCCIEINTGTSDVGEIITFNENTGIVNEYIKPPSNDGLYNFLVIGNNRNWFPIPVPVLLQLFIESDIGPLASPSSDIAIVYTELSNQGTGISYNVINGVITVDPGIYDLYFKNEYLIDSPNTGAYSITNKIFSPTLGTILSEITEVKDIGTTPGGRVTSLQLRKIIRADDVIEILILRDTNIINGTSTIRGDSEGINSFLSIHKIG